VEESGRTSSSVSIRAALSALTVRTGFDSMELLAVCVVRDDGHDKVIYHLNVVHDRFVRSSAFQFVERSADMLARTGHY